jgi:nucleotide-binding universal stress UspA family protein
MDPAKVIVGVDGSRASESAIRWAASEAVARGTRLEVLHAFVWSMFHVPLGPTEAAPGMRAAAERILREAVETAEKAAPGLEIDSTLVDGFPSPIMNAASRNAGLLVIGSRGLGTALGLLLGSTGIDLTAGAHCPVAVIPPDWTRSGSRVLIGYDGSPASQSAVELGAQFARQHGLVARLVAVQPPETERHRVSPDELSAVIAARAGAADTEVVQVEGHPAEQLLRLSADAQAIVVGSRGRGGFKGLLLGSVSQAVLHHAERPVIVIPPAAVSS